MKKSLWEKEKMLATSDFSFVYNVLKGFFPKVVNSLSARYLHLITYRAEITFQ